MNLLYGALVLGADSSVSDIELPIFDNVPKISGVHVDGRATGRWAEICDVAFQEVYLPQRHKSMIIRCTDDTILPVLAAGLEGLDSEHVGARQIFKLGKLMASLPQDRPWASVVNIMACGSPDAQAASGGSFYLLAQGVDLYLYVLCDLKDGSVRLVWATVDIKPLLREQDLIRYAFYALPTLQSSPLFIPTQFVCSRWWSFLKTFGASKTSLIRACNALEVLLYKDPSKDRV